jgi:hypothetical protein
MIQKFFGGVFAMLILSAGIASADTFSFSYSSVLDNSISASGIITATPSGVGTYTILDVTGIRNTLNIAFVANPNPSQFAVDNVLVFPPDPAFLTATTFSGFVIQTNDGLFNPWYNFQSDWGGIAGHYYEYSGGSVPGPEITFSAQAVPDGGMTIMLLGGVLVGLETLRRKFRG